MSKHVDPDSILLKMPSLRAVKAFVAAAKYESFTLGAETYRVYKSGSYIAFVETTNVTSGSLDLLSFFNHIIDKGWIPATSTLGAIDYGVELVSTDGTDATFELSAFSLTTN
jgi:hypothetical protein